VQKLIAKYGAAAHLALLAVAPLFLFPFVGTAETASVLLWLSLPALAWIILEPSVRSGEMLHRARQRVVRSMITDPLFWASLFLLILAGLRAFNCGISLVYDAEMAKWSIAQPPLPILPGCVAGKGFLPFSALVAGVVLMMGCRHSLGRSARMSFLLVSSSLAGLAAVIAIVVGTLERIPAVESAIACSPIESYYVGAAFYLCLLGGTVALVAAFEHHWTLLMPLFALSIGGTAAGGFLFSPVIVTTVFVSAEVILLAYVFVYASKVLASAGEFRLLVVSGLAFVLGGLLVMTLKPEATQERIEAFKSLEFLPASLVAIRQSLSGIALQSWLSHLWIGTGLGSFPIAFRFHATPEDWQLIRAGAQTVPNGWWLLLAERGGVGALVLGLPVGFLAFTYVKRLIGWIGLGAWPHPSCCVGPLVLISLAVTGLYGCAFLRADVTIVSMALLAISANSFPRNKRKNNG